MSDAQISQEHQLTVGVDDPISTKQGLLLGLQHVLAMDVYVPPVLIATAIALSPADGAGLIQSTFLGAGLASLIQILFFLKLPVCQGPSFVPIGAIIGIYMGSGKDLGTVMGASLAGALAVILLGYTGIFKSIVQRYLPRLVSGTIIMIVGLTLLPNAFKSNIYVDWNGFTMAENLLLAAVTAGVLLLTSMIGDFMPKFGKLFRISSVIIALFVGSALAYSMGGMSFEAVAQAPWLSMPHIVGLNYGLTFEWSSIVTMLIIYMVLLAETTGTWYAVGAVTKQELTENQVNRGVIGEGFGCLVGSLVGATPVTGYSTNAGIIALTGVASKKVFILASGWFIALAFLGKLAALIHSIPSSVIGGVFAIVCMVIMLSGFRVIKEDLDQAQVIYVVGVPLVLAIGLVFLPDALREPLPNLLRYLVDSPIAVGAIAAIVMNRLVPKSV